MEGITETSVQIPVVPTTHESIQSRLIVHKNKLKGLGEKVYYLPINRFSLDGMKSLCAQNLIICPVNQTILTLREHGKPDLIYPLPQFMACLVPLNQETPRQAIDRLLAFLKLFKEELPQIDFCLNPPEESKILFHYIIWQRESMPGAFVLKKSEKDRFKRAWVKYGDQQCDNFALSRYLGADFEPYDQDMLIYLVEALESLLCPNERGEIRFKFSSRGTVVLGQKMSNDEKISLNKRLKKAYDYRSTITHGGDASNIPFDEFNPLLRKLTRQCIYFFREYNALGNTNLRRQIIEDMTIYNVKTLSPRRYK